MACAGVSYCCYFFSTLLQPAICVLVSANLSSVAFRSRFLFFNLKVHKRVEVSVCMSLTPSTLVRSLRTEAAQPPHVMPGRLRTTSSIPSLSMVETAPLLTEPPDPLQPTKATVQHPAINSRYMTYSSQTMKNKSHTIGCSTGIAGQVHGYQCRDGYIQWKMPSTCTLAITVHMYKYNRVDGDVIKIS